MVRVHIVKKETISREFSGNNNFGLEEFGPSKIWSLIGWGFGPSSYRQIHSVLMALCREFLIQNMKHHKDMLIKATIAGGGVIPHIHKSLLEKQRAQGESGPAASAKSNWMTHRYDSWRRIVHHLTTYLHPLCIYVATNGHFGHESATNFLPILHFFRFESPIT